MDAWRNSKKISLGAVAILFLFTFFNLILDAPRKSYGLASSLAYPSEVRGYFTCSNKSYCSTCSNALKVGGGGGITTPILF